MNNKRNYSMIRFLPEIIFFGQELKVELVGELKVGEIYQSLGVHPLVWVYLSHELDIGLYPSSSHTRASLGFVSTTTQTRKGRSVWPPNSAGRPWDIHGSEHRGCCGDGTGHGQAVRQYAFIWFAARMISEEIATGISWFQWSTVSVLTPVCLREPLGLSPLIPWQRNSTSSFNTRGQLMPGIRLEVRDGQKSLWQTSTSVWNRPVAQLLISLSESKRLISQDR